MNKNEIKENLNKLFDKDFIEIFTSKKTAWFNRQKFMKSPQLAKAQRQFIKLKGRIEIDETFIRLGAKPLILII